MFICTKYSHFCPYSEKEKLLTLMKINIPLIFLCMLYLRLIHSCPISIICADIYWRITINFVYSAAKFV